MYSVGFIVTCLCITVITPTTGHQRGIKFDYKSNQTVNGSQVVVHSVGEFADIVFLDNVTSLKRLKCEKNKVVVIGNDSSIGRNWNKGQIIAGGSGWDCFLNSLDPERKGIYGVIEHLSFAKAHRVDVFIKPARPLDVFRNATISVRYSPTKTNLMAPHSIGTCQKGSLAGPFHVIKPKGRSDLDVLPQNSPGSNKKSNTDLLAEFESCSAQSDIAFNMTLVLREDKNGIKHIHSFYNKVNISFNSHLKTKLDVFRQTIVNETLDSSPEQLPQEILSVPVSMVSGLPPLMLQVFVTPETKLKMDVFAGPGESHVTAELDSTADYSACQEYKEGKGIKQHMEVSDIDIGNVKGVWTDVHQDVKMETEFSHNLKLTAHLSLLMADMYPLYSFPMEFSSKPAVAVVSKRTGSIRSTKLTSSLSASTDVLFSIGTGHREFLWKKQKLQIGNNTLSSVVNVECHNNEIESAKQLKMADVCGAKQTRIIRGDYNFTKLSQIRGDEVLFMSEETNGTWCDHQKRKCSGCSGKTSTNASIECADRMMTPSLALLLSKLAVMTKVTWVDRKIVVLRAWNEATSQHQTGNTGDSALYYEGRAAQLGLSQPLSGKPHGKLSLDNTQSLLATIGKFALCSGFPYVRQVPSEGYLEVAVRSREDADKIAKSLMSEDEKLQKKMFMSAMAVKDSDVKECSDILQQSFAINSTFPSNMTVDEVCGRLDVSVDRSNIEEYSKLYEYTLMDVQFEAEGPSSSWCGSKVRGCMDNCSKPSNSGEPWQWCSRRVMTPRLANRLRELSRLVKDMLKGQKITTPVIKVEMSHKEPTKDETSSPTVHPLYTEGRGTRLSLTTPKLGLDRLVLLSICAGFDYVSYTSPNYIEVFVKKQDGYTSYEVDFPSDNLLVVDTPHSQANEYAYPHPLASESRKSMLFDGSNPEIALSDNFRIGDFVFPGLRYFRLDSGLVKCLEKTQRSFTERIHILPGSAYRSDTANHLRIENRHSEEFYRFQSGQAVEITTKDLKFLRLLAETAIRGCIPSLHLVQWGLGLGLHSDRIYLDIRSQVGDKLVHVWNSGGDTDSFIALKQFAAAIQAGGSVILPSDVEEACRESLLGRDFYYLTLHSEAKDFCTNDGKLCTETQVRRQEESEDLMNRLIAAAGSDALHKSDIATDTKECVLNQCGGCPGSGRVWLQKTIACAKLIRTFVKKASSPFPELHNRVTFYSSTTTFSKVHHMACEGDNVCIEKVPLYAVIVTLLESKYNVKGSDTIQERLFGGEDNPSPLMELVEQELAMQASGNVTVFIESDDDLSILRNVIKILTIYNTKVNNVKFYLTSDVRVTKFVTSLRRKIDIWSSSVCPHVSRVAVTPFSVDKIPGEKQRRSVEGSKSRNERKFAAKNWELEWLDSI